MSLIRRIAFFAILLILWELVARRGWWDSTLFPAPSKIGATLWHTFSDGTLLNATTVSLRRVLLGYTISLVIGVPLGIVIARKQWMEDTVGSLVTGFQALPSICWLPIALLWFGLNDRAILFVVIMGSLVSITVAVVDGVHNLPPQFIRAARTMGTRRMALYTEVLLPACLPALITGAKLGWAYAWRALMSGELLFVSMGLGHMLMMGRELADMSQVMAVMLVIIAIGLMTDRAIFGVIEQRVRERWGTAKAVA